MSALIGNPLMLTSAPAADDDSYKIEKSLRFNEDDSAYLSRTPSTKGNRRTWTWSAWIKLGKLEDNGYIFASRSDNDNRLYLKYNSDGTLYGFTGNSNSKSFTTARKLRDPSAWYHIVWVWDSNNDIERERQKVYINNELTTNTATNSYSQTFEGAINDSIEHRLCNAIHQNEIFDGYMADVHFIDGLALSPAAFGSLDSTGVWNPKAFALSAPNDGSTWSAGSTTGTASPAWTTLFESDTFDSGPSTGAGGDITLDLTNQIAYTTSLRIYAGNGSGSGCTAGSTDTAISLKSGGVWYIIHGAPGWIDASAAPSPITDIKVNVASGSGSPGLKAIEVDGVPLVDGQTDPEIRNNPNNSRTWSDDMSSTGGWHNNNNPDRTFNGVIPNMSNSGVSTYGGQGGTITFAPTGGIAYKNKVELYTDAGHTYTVNGGSNQTFGPATGQSNGTWYTIATGEGTLTSLTWTPQNTNYYPSSGAMRVDGHILVDGIVDNSFHLKFNDITKNRYLGKDTLNGKIADATGGLPIYKTTDDYGDVKGSGNRTDSLSGNLKLAIPGDSVTSTAMDVSSADHDVTVDGVTVSTNQSRLYGSSLFFVDDNTHRLTVEHADMAMGTGDFCIEFWVYILTNECALISTRETANNTSAGFVIASGGSGHLYVHSNAAVAGAYTSGTKLPLNQWCHVAYTRASGTHRIFLNGVADSVTTTTSRDYTEDKLCIGDNGYAQDEPFDGYMQDIRVYKGAAKYTSNFKPPTRNDFTVNNLKGTFGTTGNYLSIASVSPSLPSGWESGRDKLSYVFDGGTVANQSDYILYGSTGQNFTLTFSTGIAVTSSIEIFAGGYGTETKAQTNLNGSEVTYTNNAWSTIYSGSGTFTSLTMTTTNDHRNALYGIKVDGVVLVDTDTVAPLVDSYVDSPTSYGTDTGIGGEVRGNYATWNPIHESIAGKMEASDGNLTSKQKVNWGGGLMATMGAKTGKWYYELTAVDETNSRPVFGIVPVQYGAQLPGEGGANSVGYRGTGVKRINTSGGNEQSYGDAWEDGDIIGVALDCTNGAVYFSRNGTWQASGVPTSGTSRTNACHTWTGSSEYMIPSIAEESASTSIINFGQRAFKYTAPNGFKCLCTQNLDNLFDSETSENDPSKYFDVNTYRGTGASLTFSGLGFGPDLIWTKQRTSTGEPRIQDVVRGTNSQIRPNTDAGQLTESNNVTAFNSDGYTIGANGDINSSSQDHVAWLWDAGTAAATASTDGSITPSAQWKNATAGFSISKYTGNGTNNATVGHALGDKPGMVWIKRTDATQNWVNWIEGVTDGKSLYFNLTDDEWARPNGYIGGDGINNTVVKLVDGSSGGDNVNGSSAIYMMYTWTPIVGYSSFGKFIGNGSADGPYIHTGFSPRWIMTKNATGAARDWVIWDTKRSPYNFADECLFANEDDAEATKGPTSGTDNDIDILSNGFKIRNIDSAQNESTKTIVYAAFAEHPFKTARAN